MTSYVPKSIKRLYAQKGSLTIVALVLATGATAPFGLGWHQLEIVAFLGLAALVADLWIEADRGEQTHEGELQARDQAVIAAERANSELTQELQEAEQLTTRLTELQLENFALIVERDELKGRLEAPSFSLEETLITVDWQVSVLDLVRKHRTLESAGTSQWPVTELRLGADGAVQITAHAEAHAEQALGEIVALVGSDTILGNAQVATAAGHVITAVMTVDQLAEWVQTQLYEQSVFHPQGIALRLAGLTVLPYIALSDDQLSGLREALRSAASTIHDLLNPSAQLALESEARDIA